MEVTELSCLLWCIIVVDAALSAADADADADATIVLACSPSPTGSVQSLQAKLLAARKKNELLVELEKGVNSEGYPLCQYRKGFIDHLKGKAPFISVSRAEYNMI